MKCGVHGNDGEERSEKMKVIHIHRQAVCVRSGICCQCDSFTIHWRKRTSSLIPVSGVFNVRKPPSNFPRIRRKWDKFSFCNLRGFCIPFFTLFHPKSDKGKQDLVVCVCV